MAVLRHEFLGSQPWDLSLQHLQKNSNGVSGHLLDLEIFQGPSRHGVIRNIESWFSYSFYDSLVRYWIVLKPYWKPQWEKSIIPSNPPPAPTKRPRGKKNTPLWLFEGHILTSSETGINSTVLHHFTQFISFHFSQLVVICLLVCLLIYCLFP